MNVEGYLIRVKEHYKKDVPEKLMGISMLIRKDPYDDKDDTNNWFSFWLNREADWNLYNQFKPILEKVRDAGPADFKISGEFETRKVGERIFKNLTKFNVRESSAVNKAFASESASMEPEYTVEDVEYAESLPTAKEIKEREKEKFKLSGRDLMIARENVINGTVNIANMEERIKAMKRLIKWIEEGE